MNELIVTTTEMPIVCGCDHLTASEPFYHADRTLDFNVLIYVADGVIMSRRTELIMRSARESCCF